MQRCGCGLSMSLVYMLAGSAGGWVGVWVCRLVGGLVSLWAVIIRGWVFGLVHEVRASYIIHALYLFTFREKLAQELFGGHRFLSIATIVSSIVLGMLLILCLLSPLPRPIAS